MRCKMSANEMTQSGHARTIGVPYPGTGSDTDASVHHIRCFRSFVMAITTESVGFPILTIAEE
jgi:hypothetical protein